MPRPRLRPRPLVLAGLLAGLAAVAGIAPPPGSARHASLRPGPWCGGSLWRDITFSDADRGQVAADPQAAGIPTIGTFQRPRRIDGHRTTPFQRHLWQFEVIVDRYRIGSDGEIALILYDIPSNRYMNAYLANPHCLSRTSRMRSRIAAARQALTSRCPRVTASWQLLGITAKITGVGYWNPLTITRGALPNGAELRPIVDFQVVSGCGVG